MNICARFNLFPDDTVLGSSFRYSNFDFSSKSGAAIAVNETDREKGITITPNGIVVGGFVRDTHRVDFRIGIWDDNDITVYLKDSEGNTIDSRVFSGRDAYIDSYFNSEREIHSIEFDTNGNEELLVSLCIRI